MSHKLDIIDAKILEILQKDDTIPITDIADRIGSSKSVVWRRIQALQDTGIIKKRVALLDRTKIGLSVMIFANVKMMANNRESLPHFIERVREFPEVIECHTLMGDIDFLLKIVVGDVTEYERFFWEKLSQIDGVRDINSSIALTAVKDTTALPIKV
jgi:Lrp/AsnC family transcriptional regulator